MKFSIKTIAALNVYGYHTYISQISSWNSYDYENAHIIINGTTDSMTNFVFTTPNTSLSNIRNICDHLQERGLEATWPSETENCILHKITKSERLFHIGSTPHQNMLNLKNYKPLAQPKDLRYVEVTDAEKLAMLDSTSHAIFRHDANIIKLFFRGLANGGSERLKFFLVYYQDSLIGMCGMYMDANGVAGLYGDGIFSEYRNRGFGSSLVLHRIKIAQEFGCHTAVVHCMPMSQRIYPRLGFDFLKKLHLYIFIP